MSDEEASPSPRGRRTWLRRKTKRRLAVLLLVALAFVFYRGLMASTENNFSCQYRVFYAVCTPKFKNAQFPGLWEIMRAGSEF